MGNKKSTPKNSPHETYTNKYDPADNQDILRKHGKKGKKKERPLSDPGISEGGDAMPSNFNQFYLRPISSGRDGAISGKGILGVTALPIADYEEPVSTQPPSGVQVDLYKQALEQVLQIWPEYFPVKEISICDTSTGVVNTLQQMANRLCQQHSSIKKLSVDCHELKQILDELQEERDSLKQLMHKRETEIVGFKEDKAILVGELRRRGHDVKLPHRTADYGVTNYDSDNILTPRSDTSSYEKSEDDIGRRRSTKEGIYSPTPLILAEGGRSRVSLTKKLSIRRSEDETWRDSNASDDLKERVKWLQTALEKEKERNNLLRGEPQSPRSQIRKVSQMSFEDLSNKYTSIQHEAFDKVRRQVNNNLGHVHDERQWSFISHMMEESYRSARNAAEQLQETIINILMLPTSPQTAMPRRSGIGEFHHARRNGSILDNVRKFEEFGLKSQIKKSSTRPLPDEVLDSAFSFISENSDITDVTTLIESTIDGLTKEFPDCVTPALLNQSTFTNFMHSICRLSWQLNIHNPPLHVTADLNKFETRYHVTVNSESSTPGEDIKMYLWPVLLTKRHGDVLCKGVVKI